MPQHRERLWPSPWMYVATALVIPAALLTFLPIDPTVGVVVAIGLYAAIVIALVASAPRVEVADGELRAGSARLPLDLVGEVAAFRGEEATLERGRRLDARAWLLIRGWIDPVVRVEVRDDADPTPYWLVSTRSPDALVRSLRRDDA
jgi:hypothetical protein